MQGFVTDGLLIRRLPRRAAALDQHHYLCVSHTLKSSTTEVRSLVFLYEYRNTFTKNGFNMRLAQARYETSPDKLVLRHGRQYTIEHPVHKVTFTGLISASQSSVSSLYRSLLCFSMPLPVCYRARRAVYMPVRRLPGILASCYGPIRPAFGV